MTKPLVYKNDGSQVGLGERIGRGGEGEVYALANDNSLAVKIYSGSGGADREDKIAAMLAAKLCERTQLAAFPIHAVQSRSGEFAGFIMRRISGYKPLFELYAPGARKHNFPRASYPFLIQAAQNFAKAVGSVHSTGCIIGDINHSGVLIAGNATVSLIDADSFQIVNGSKWYLCRVGVPDYTPPELQGTKLDSVVRTTDHDNFGVAIVIFQLLCMGRHPFSGSYHNGEMPIERAIGEHRFAYGTRRNVGMKPPPGAPLLKHFPPSLGAAFEDAFGPATVRPDARQWIDLLQELQRALRICNHNPTHHYWRGSTECPWCRMERVSGIALFPASNGATASAVSTGFNLDLVWKVIQETPPPGPWSNSPQLHPCSPRPRAEADRLHAEALKTKFLGGGAAVAAGAILISSPALWIVWIPLGWFGLAKLFGKAGDVGNLRSKKRDLEQQWTTAFATWQAQCSGAKFDQVKSDLQKAKSSYHGLAAEQTQRITKYQQNRRSIQLKTYLSTFYIRKAKISGIGPSKTATLASYGIETAADVTSSSKIEQVPGFGPATAMNLLGWRRSIESRFVYNPNPNSADQVELSKIKADIGNREVQFRETLKNGPEFLRSARQSALSRRKAVDPTLQRLHEQLAQVKADLERVHGKIEFPSFWLAGVALAIVLILAVVSGQRSIPSSESKTSVTPNSSTIIVTSKPAQTSTSSTPPPDEVMPQEILSSSVRYAVRLTNVRARPGTNYPIVGTLERAAAVRGVVVPVIGTDKQWLKIVEGTYKGYYVSGEANLSVESRPTIDTSYAGLKQVINPTLALTLPFGSKVVQEFSPGTTLRVIGTTSDGFAEVSLNSGAIVYVEVSALGERKEPELPTAPALPLTTMATPEAQQQPLGTIPVVRAVPLGRLTGLASGNDYPDSAVSAGAEGRTVFRLTVDRLGRVASCTVVVSSGSVALDERTCLIMTSRARFLPARDGNGYAVPDSFTSSISWVLP